MTGTLHQIENNWIIRYQEPYCADNRCEMVDCELSLHPDNVNQFREYLQIFDNFEARIYHNSTVEFEIVDEYARITK